MANLRSVRRVAVIHSDMGADVCRLTARKSCKTERARIERRTFLRANAALAAALCLRPRTTAAVEASKAPPGIYCEHFDFVTINFRAPIVAAAYNDPTYEGKLSKGIIRIDPQSKAAESVVAVDGLMLGTGALSPDGRYLSYGTRRQYDTPEEKRTDMRGSWVTIVDTLHVHDLVTGQATTHASENLRLDRYCWLPDSRRIALRADARPKTQATVQLLRVEDRSGTPAVSEDRVLKETSHLPAFAPNGNLMAYLDRNQDVVIEWVGERSSGFSGALRPYRPKEEGMMYWGPQWSPDGRHLLLIESIPQTRRLELALSEVATDTNAFGPAVSLGARPLFDTVSLEDEPPLAYARWSPDGKTLAYQGFTVRGANQSENRFDRYDLYLYFLQSKQSEQLTEGGRLPPPKATGQPVVVWSPDNTRIAFTKQSQPMTKENASRSSPPAFALDLWLANVHNKEARPLTTGFGHIPFAWR